VVIPPGTPCVRGASEIKAQASGQAALQTLATRPSKWLSYRRLQTKIYDHNPETVEDLCKTGKERR